MFKVTSAVGSSDQTTSSLDLVSDLKISQAGKDKIKQDVGDYLVEQILMRVQSAKSPVAGESFPGLSPKYKKLKKGEGLGSAPNLTLYGDMLDALTYETTSEGIDIGFFGDQAAKADGHNNFSGDSLIPKRRFLPDAGQDFIPSIQKEITKIIGDALADEVEPKESDFADVNTKAELYSSLEDYFPEMNRSEIKSAIMRSAKFIDFLESNDLLGLL